MKHYEEPKMDVQEIEVEDVITTSDTVIEDGGEWN